MFFLTLKKQIKCSIILFALFFTSVLGQAATVTWIGGNGQWFDINNWDIGDVPGTEDLVIIPSGHVIINTYTAKCDQINISANAIVTVAPGGTFVTESVANSYGVINYGEFYCEGTANLESIANGAGYSRGIHNFGKINISGQLNIGFFTSFGIYNEEVGEVIITGSVTMSDLSIGISNYGVFENTGYIEIKDVHGGLGNFYPGKFYNYGDIEIFDIDGSSSGAIGNSSIFTNYASGYISITNFIGTSSGFSNFLSTAYFRNKGEIHMENVTGGLAAFSANGGWFRNQPGSRLEIKYSGPVGIRISPGIQLTNKGEIFIQGTSTMAIEVRGSMINFSAGGVVLYANNGRGLYTSGVYQNYGFTSIGGSSQEGVFNAGVVKNRPKGIFGIGDEIFTQYGTTFINAGHLSSSYQGTHQTYGPFTNTGIIADKYESFSGITNNSVRVIPWSGAVTVGVPFANAFDLGNWNYASIVQWSTALPGVSPGTYDSSNNTFTPNSNAVGLTSIFVLLKVNQSGRKRWYEIQIPGGVQSFNGGGGSNFQHNDDLAQEASERDSQNDFANDFKLFPNPASDQVNIQFGTTINSNTEMVLSNSLGQEVLRQTIEVGNQLKLNIPASVINGTYTISILENGNRVSSKRLTVVR